MKILYVTTIASTMGFFTEHIKMLLAEGHTVELACNTQVKAIPGYFQENNFRIYHIPFSRSPLAADNIKAYCQFRKLVRTECYDIVHTHTPNASVLVRLACRNLRKKGLKVFYTAHGFHFYKGAPLQNWLLYCPVEKLCSRWTDTLITINQEDFAYAKKQMHAGTAAIIPGVGVDLTRFTEAQVNREAVRKALGIAQHAKVLIYVAELNRNKNQSSLLDMLVELKKNLPEAALLLVGAGDMRENLEEQAKRLGIRDSVFFAGRRRDVPQLLKASDICVPSSIREGFGLNLVEAMACGIPVVAYDNRGHRTIIRDGENGYLVPLGDCKAMAARVNLLLNDPAGAERITDFAYAAVSQYSAQNAVDSIKDIYDNAILAAGGHSRRDGAEAGEPVAYGK